MTVQITASDLRKIGVSKPYAHQLISGSRTPSLRLAVQISAAYGIPTSAWPLQGGGHGAAPTADAPSVAPTDSQGADKPQENVSRTGAPA